MQDLENTQYFKVEVEPENGVKMILSEVYEALSEKGYDPVSQIVGYIMSGDPTYITSYRNARGLIGRVERDAGRNCEYTQTDTPKTRAIPIPEARHLFILLISPAP